MNDPKADLQTFFTDYFTVANITNLTIIPNVERYESTAESYIRWISQGAPRYDDMGDKLLEILKKLKDRSNYEL